MRTRTFLLTGLVVALLLGGVASYYASSHPDGLEHVAEQVGFGDTADDHPVADGPMADYQVSGVDDARLSGGLAGVVGILVTLGLAGGVAFAVRRREPHDADAD
jgi:cobalt/nickel transport protein